MSSLLHAFRTVYSLSLKISSLKIILKGKIVRLNWREHIFYSAKRSPFHVKILVKDLGSSVCFIRYLEKLRQNIAVSGKDFMARTSQDNLYSVQSIEEDVLGTEMGKIDPYEGEALASSDDSGGSLEENERHDKDGLSADLTRFRKVFCRQTAQFFLLCP